MRFCWPEDKVFHRLVLDVERDCCDNCGRRLHIGDHRIRYLYTLEHPLERCCRLAPCSDPACPSRPHSLSAAAELFGTTGGQVYASPDGGDNWSAVVRDLPPVYSVEVQTLP